MKSQHIRERFLDFFEREGHTRVSSSSLVPHNDATLLFTNAGMVPFKNAFLGEAIGFRRATSSQRCVRAGGKHNDLENVGYTARHHTFFEMLGNFSFGDYFKREAIHFAWRFLTEELKIPPERLWVTVFEEDTEAENIWLHEIKIPKERLSRIGAKDNFWAMGDTGPCGPCSEIFYDHGPEIPGGPPGTPDENGDRFIEIWNLVFMQYNRAPDGTLTPLPQPSVDTGMGLERITAVLQGVHNNYDTDLFTPIIRIAAQYAQIKDLTHYSLRVIADHLRSTTFLISDGVTPSNEGRGYVLRRIMRRAMRHGYQLGLQEPFFYRLVPTLVHIMGEAYPELKSREKNITEVIQQEEEQFARTLSQGLKLLEEAFTALGDHKTIPGSLVFKLYDTYGFPVDLTADVAREKGLTLDTEGFAHEMEKQRLLSKASSKFGSAPPCTVDTSLTTLFKGYEHLSYEATVQALYHGKEAVERLNTGTPGVVVLDQTPFYAESGGQVGDQGRLLFDTGTFEVSDTKKIGHAIAHYGVVRTGTLSVGMKVAAHVDEAARTATALNHSATHLLHAALKQVLGAHVEQKGSLVDKDRLRFDFSQKEALRKDQQYAIETLVNSFIRANRPIVTELMPLDAALKSGVVALFGEKYGAHVRVLTMGDFSRELCGGTHATYTGDIGLFKIVEEVGIAAGVRRIEAVTGKRAVEHMQQKEALLAEACALVKTNPSLLIEKLHGILQHQKHAEKTIEQLQKYFLEQRAEQLLTQFTTERGEALLITEVKESDSKLLRSLAERLRSRLPHGNFLLAAVAGDRVHLVAGLNNTLLKHFTAQDWIHTAAAFIEGKGGGRPDFAQASGSKVAGLTQALAAAKTFFQER